MRKIRLARLLLRYKIGKQTEMRIRKDKDKTQNSWQMLTYIRQNTPILIRSQLHLTSTISLDEVYVIVKLGTIDR